MFQLIMKRADQTLTVFTRDRLTAREKGEGRRDEERGG